MVVVVVLLLCCGGDCIYVVVVVVHGGFVVVTQARIHLELFRDSLLWCALIHALPYVLLRGYDFCPLCDLESEKCH